MFSRCRYFPSPDTEFPAVIYSAEDVRQPAAHSCASHGLHLKMRERWLGRGAHNHSHAPGPGHRFESLPESSHFHDGVLRVEEPSRAPPRARLKQKRASGDLYDKRKTTCMLYLQADHLFYEKMGRSEEACIEVRDYKLWKKPFLIDGHYFLQEPRQCMNVAFIHIKHESRLFPHFRSAVLTKL